MSTKHSLIYKNFPEVSSIIETDTEEMRLYDKNNNRLYFDLSEILKESGVSELRNRISAERYKHEVSGININGIEIATDDRSKLLLSGAAFEATIIPDYTLKWKTEGGFIQLDGEQVISIGLAVRSHVQACFDREAELIERLEEGSFTEDMLEKGWPN